MTLLGSAVSTTDLPLRLQRRGKVRDVYEVDADRLLIVATDRISAFDVVMRQPIPDKGVVLTQITAWWLARGGAFAPNHLIAVADDQIVAAVPQIAHAASSWTRRAMLVKRTQPVPFECVVRGYLSGSAWNEYKVTGTLAGEPLPLGLIESARLDTPIFSPATKAEEGHDENVTFERMVRDLGEDLATELRKRSLAIYTEGRTIAENADIIIADTKFEFGRTGSELLLIDEVLTPDSSRFWPRETYVPGGPQPSLDKQPVRDYLENAGRAGQMEQAISCAGPARRRDTGNQ